MYSDDEDSYEDEPPVREYSTRDDFEDDPNLTDDQLRQLLGFKPRPRIVDGTSLLAQFRGKNDKKDCRDAYGAEFWRNYVPRWEHLPDLVLEQIVCYLNIPDKHSVSQVCRNWYRVFHSPHCWRHFQLDDRTLTKRKYTRYFGYIRELDHYRMQFCLQKTAPFWHTIHVKPMSSLMNLFNFVTLSAHFSRLQRERRGAEVFAHLHTFEFCFSPDLLQQGTERHDNHVYGTGGQLLKGVMDLLSELRFLRHLILTNLLLEKALEATSLLDEVAANCMLTLQTLSIVNLTRGPVTFLHPGAFLNLRVLKMSPQNLHADVLIAIAEGCRHLKEIHLMHNQYTEIGMMLPAKNWIEFHKINPRIRVKLVFQGRSKRDLIWQERCPVDSVVFDSQLKPLTAESAIIITTLYGPSLENLIYLGLPRFHQSHRFCERCDSSLVLLVRQCTQLKRLVIREVISTCTLLLIAFYGRRANLNLLVVRGNALRQKFDFPASPEWTPDFLQWLKSCSTTFEACFAEVRQLLGDPFWRPLTDKEFIKVNDYEAMLQCDRINYNF